MDPEDEINELAEEKSLLRHTLKLLRKEWIRKCENDEDEATIFLIDAMLFRTGEKDRFPSVEWTYKGRVYLSDKLQILSPKDTPLLTGKREHPSNE